MELTQERLKQVLHYDAETGVFTRKVMRGRPSRTPGAGVKDNIYGYILMGVDGRLYRAHRLAWLYIYGRFPAHHLDHINGVRDDNRIINLREATVSQNQCNRAGTSKTGFKGVYFLARTGRWYAMIQHQKKKHFLGYHDTPEAAAIAYRDAAERMFGEFATPGFMSLKVG